MTAKTELSVSKRRTRAEVQQLVAEFMSSGMRRSEFYQSRGLSFSHTALIRSWDEKSCREDVYQKE
jgi:hypothetical protein